MGVNPIQAATAEAFQEILQESGVPVVINGTTYLATVSANPIQIELEEGGYRQDGSMVVKILISHLNTPLPKFNDTVMIGEVRYKIEEITRKPGSGIIRYLVNRR
jgi:hypothetical protein